MLFRRIILLLTGFVFSWLMTSHAFICVGEYESGSMEKKMASVLHSEHVHDSGHSSPNNRTNSPASCKIGCPTCQFFIVSPLLWRSFVQKENSVRLPTYQFLYEQPILAFEPFPPIQA